MDGTPQENVRQREERNRRTPYLPRGSQHWSAKLSEKEVEALRRARELGVPAEACAAIFQISRSSVYNAWAQVHYPPQAPPSHATQRLAS